MHVLEMVSTKPVFTACRVQGIRIEDDPGSRISIGHQISGHAPSHRPARQEETIDLAGEQIRGSSMGLEQPLGAIGSLRSPLGVGVVERHHGVPRPGQPLPEPGHERMVLIGTGAVGEEDPVRAGTGEPARHLAIRPGRWWSWLPWRQCTAVTVSRWRCWFMTRRLGSLRQRPGEWAGSYPPPPNDSPSAWPVAPHLRPPTESLRDQATGWDRVDAWLSDERWVPHDHERSNGQMAAIALFDHVGAVFHRPIWGELIEPGGLGRSLRGADSGPSTTTVPPMW